VSTDPVEPTPAEVDEHVRVLLARLDRKLAEGDRAQGLATVLALLQETGKSPTVQERLARLADTLTERQGRSSRARKVSVSMPEDIAAAVQRRVGRGAFSQYVTAAVTEKLELDLLAELSTLLEADHGPVPEELLAEAEAAWPDGD
jgi:Arc/MetJ-type ribon-helix-helix transcriptional regulator